MTDDDEPPSDDEVVIRPTAFQRVYEQVVSEHMARGLRAETTARRQLETIYVGQIEQIAALEVANTVSVRDASEAKRRADKAEADKAMMSDKLISLNSKLHRSHIRLRVQMYILIVLVVTTAVCLGWLYGLGVFDEYTPVGRQG